MKKIYKDTIWVFLGNLLSSLLAYVLMVACARLMFPQDFGYFSIVLAFMTMLTDISDFGLNTSMVKFVSQSTAIGDHKSVASILQLNFLSKGIISIILIVVGISLSGFISKNVFHMPAIISPLQISFLGIPGIFLVGIFYSLYQARQQYVRRVLWSVGIVAFRLMLLILFFFWNGNKLYIVPVVVIYIIAPYIFLIPFVQYLLEKKEKVEIKQEDIKKTFNFGKWFIIISVGLILLGRIDLFLLARFCDARTVGFYSAGYKLASLAQLINSSLIMILFPVMSAFKDTAQIYQFISKKWKWVILISIALLPFAFLGSPAINLIYGKEYIPATGPFMLIYFGFIINFLTNFFEVTLWSINRPDIDAWYISGSVLLSLILNILLIPIFGALGAALSFLILKVLGFLFIVPITFYNLKKKAVIL